MIKVNRRRIPVPASLAGAGSLGATEQVANARRLAASPPESPVFSVYKQPDVIAALRQLFGPKCAYCEWRYAAGGPPDVEHYRPKSEVRQSRGAPATDGYWWLAADWDNLHASCNDCNRRRYHEFPNGPRELRGKENLFPVAAPVVGAWSPGCEGGEQRLLLDPCRDDPELALSWSDDGAVGEARPGGGPPHPMALPSINCYGLDRPELFTERMSLATRIRGDIVHLKKLKMIYRQTKHPELRDVIEERMTALKAYAAPDAAFSAMAAAIIRRNYGPI